MEASIDACQLVTNLGYRSTAFWSLPPRPDLHLHPPQPHCQPAGVSSLPHQCIGIHHANNPAGNKHERLRPPKEGAAISNEQGRTRIFIPLFQFSSFLTSYSSLLHLHLRIRALASFFCPRPPPSWNAAINSDMNRLSVMLTKPIADYAPGSQSRICRRAAISLQK